jgi:hypothetical protein
MLNKACVLSGRGRGSIMMDSKQRNLNSKGHNFGELELVDKQLFFISANRRDT